MKNSLVFTKPVIIGSSELISKVEIKTKFELNNENYDLEIGFVNR